NGPLRHRLLNGDPHPGNSLFLADGRVAFLDFGFFKKMSEREAAIQREMLVAIHEDNSDAVYALLHETGAFARRNEDELERVMRMYDSLCGWLLRDEDVTISPDIVTAAIIEQGKMNRKEISLPADQIVATRAYVLVLAILGKLAATNNWSRIARE